MSCSRGTNVRGAQFPPRPTSQPYLTDLGCARDARRLSGGGVARFGRAGEFWGGVAVFEGTSSGVSAPESSNIASVDSFGWA